MASHESAPTAVNKTFWTLAEMAAHLGISESTAKRRSEEAGFPARRKFGPRTFRWKAAEVDAWADAQAVAPTLLSAHVSTRLTGGVARGPKGDRRRAA